MVTLLRENVEQKCSKTKKYQNNENLAKVLCSVELNSVLYNTAIPNICGKNQVEILDENNNITNRKNEHNGMLFKALLPILMSNDFKNLYDQLSMEVRKKVESGEEAIDEEIVAVTNNKRRNEYSYDSVLGEIKNVSEANCIYNSNDH